MKKRIAILFTLFLVFVLYLAPASLIVNLMPVQSPVLLAGVNGSVWSGNIANIDSDKITLNNVEYSLNPLALLLASISVDLIIPRGDISGSLNLKLDSDYGNSFKIKDSNLKINAELLNDFLPVKGSSLQGTFNTVDLDVELANQKPVKAHGQLSWRNASVLFGGQNWLLGDFVVDVTTNATKEIISGKIRKNNNELGLQGIATLDGSGMLEFIGSISTDIDKNLYSAAALFNDGKPANGRLPIKFKQKIFR